MNFSCCIEMIYTDLPFLDRFELARKDGFTHVEFWNWDDKDIKGIRQALNDTGLKLAAFQGNVVGRMVDAADHPRYLEGVRGGFEVARELDSANILLMSDVLQADRTVKPSEKTLTAEEKYASSLAMLKKVAPLAEAAGVTAVIEPLNTLVDHVGYPLFGTRAGAELVWATDSPNVRLLYDTYHMQIMEGNVIEMIRGHWRVFGHFHLADVPGRHQPGTGELNYHNILTALKATGYAGLVGFEFAPKAADESALMRELLENFRRL